MAARAFIQSEREERCSSTSVCPSVHLLSVCPPFVRQIVQRWVDFVRLSKSGSMGWCKLCATHAWETARMKTPSIDLFDFAKSVPINSFVFTYIGQSCGRIRNSQTSIFCDSDFPIEHPPFVHMWEPKSKIGFTSITSNNKRFEMYLDGRSYTSFTLDAIWTHSSAIFFFWVAWTG